MSGEDEMRDISERFYAALNRVVEGDTGPMADIWSHTAEVTAMHPIGGRQVGWDEVQQSWQQVASVFTGGWVRRTDQIIHVDGDLAYELGTEQGQVDIGEKQIQMKHRVTNIYRREGGEWKLVHHHADLSTPMMQAIQETQSGKVGEPAVG